ncbi:phosphodiester glycosidase family protein [Hymenobacter cellulosivorans]|uniref:Phosphodiester glycosidase family protein n=1 Tax=Hymenobacter cellulosivorans TaxID=2932249 RepID=A0ABY4F5E4_9BACT|nr:phosphodiester glycosidase family protein [Hymenobacter cellulosivorans]UOQ51795.1 phosphodiester glycosidase family protein [Hymenobacter cellulosivorans]
MLGGLATAALTPSSCAPADSDYVSYQVNLQKQDLRLYWKDETNRPLQSLQRLTAWLSGRGHRVVFAMNAGMFRPDYSPQGLFVEDGRVVAPLDTTSGAGNFYLKPNGVFYTTVDQHAVVCPTASFRYFRRILYATQSGPMLVVRGQIHPAFTPGSSNRQIRNGVGILPNGHVLLAMSKHKVSLYEFADYFRRQGCRNALYLDGFVSRTYAPGQQWVQTDGNFGVMLAVSE